MSSKPHLTRSIRGRARLVTGRTRPTPRWLSPRKSATSYVGVPDDSGFGSLAPRISHEHAGKARGGRVHPDAGRVERFPPPAGLTLHCQRRGSDLSLQLGNDPAFLCRIINATSSRILKNNSSRINASCPAVKERIRRDVAEIMAVPLGPPKSGGRRRPTKAPRAHRRDQDSASAGPDLYGH